MTEDEKTKDLLIKLQILKNGLIEERKKSQNYLDKIKEFEKIIEKKENEIILLTKAKFDLEAELTFEKNKRAPDPNIKKLSKEMQIEKYEEIINEQGSLLRTLNNKLISERESFEQQKIDFQTMVKAQSEQVLNLKQNLEQQRKDNDDLKKKFDDIKEMINNYEKEKIKTDADFMRYQKEKESAQKENEKLQAKIDELEKKNSEKDETINGLVKNNEDYANRLNDMKTALLTKDLTPKSFTVELLGKGKRLIEIKFQKTEDLENDSDKYEMVIIETNKTPSEKHVNLLDVSEFSLHDKDKTRIDISYNVCYIIL